MCQAAGHITHAQKKVKKLSSSFAPNSDESVVLYKLLLNVLTLRLERDLLLFLSSVESSSGSVESSGGK